MEHIHPEESLQTAFLDLNTNTDTLKAPSASLEVPLRNGIPAAEDIL